MRNHSLPVSLNDKSLTRRETRPAGPQTGTKTLLHLGHMTGMEEAVALSSMSKAMKEWPQCGQVTR